MNEKNIEPHRFKKGQSGNPHGRPTNKQIVKKRWAKLLGVDADKLRSMDVKEMPQCVAYALQLTLSEAKALRQNPAVTMAELAALSMANKMVKTGDVKVWCELHELVTGEKLFDDKKEIELSTAPGSGINIVIKDPKDAALFEDDKNF